MTTHCHICLGPIPDLDEGPQACPYCGAIAIAVGMENPYRDGRFLERACDHCGTPYSGPAVYCSLECALADA